MSPCTPLPQCHPHLLDSGLSYVTYLASGKLADVKQLMLEVWAGGLLSYASVTAIKTHLLDNGIGGARLSCPLRAEVSLDWLTPAVSLPQAHRQVQARSVKLPSPAHIS